MTKTLSHLDASNQVRMVDVGDKAVTERSASARAVVTLPTACAAVFVNAVKTGGPAPIPLEEIIEIARVSIEIAKDCQ